MRLHALASAAKRIVLCASLVTSLVILSANAFSQATT
jgi:hypothetical protein